MQHRIIAVLVIACALAPATADASQTRWKPDRPHSHRAPRMTFDRAALVASMYWQRRGVTVPCAPKVHVLSDAEDATAQAAGVAFDMLADRATCTIDVSPLSDWYRTQREYSWMYCMDIVHEVGHLAGLEHEYGGVMDPYENIVPWDCDHLRRFLARHRASIRPVSGEAPSSERVPDPV